MFPVSSQYKIGRQVRVTDRDHSIKRVRLAAPHQICDLLVDDMGPGDLLNCFTG